MKIVLLIWVFSFKRCNMFFQWKEPINTISIQWWNLFILQLRKILIHALTFSTILVHLVLKKRNLITIRTKTKLNFQIKLDTVSWNSFIRILLWNSVKHWATNIWKIISIKSTKIKTKIAVMWIRSILNRCLKDLKQKIEIKDLDKIWMRMASMW